MSNQSDKQDDEWGQYLKKVGRGVVGLGKLMELDDLDGIVFREIRVKPPVREGGDFMVIIKARTGPHVIVGFHAALDLPEAIRGAFERVKNDTMKWREDRPYPAVMGDLPT